MNLLYTSIIALLLSNASFAKSNYMESYIFERIHDGKIIQSKNIDLRLIPASLSKIPLTIIALNKWGSDYQFKTSVFYSGKLKANQIDGDIIIQASGDPMLTNEKLNELASRIKSSGINSFSGDLVIEEGSFSNLSISDPSRKERKHSRNSYDATLTGFATNFNVIPIFTTNINSKVINNTVPKNIDGVKIRARVKSGQYTSIKASRSYINNTNNINLSGNIKKNTSKDSYVSSGNAKIMAANTLKAILNNQGIEINGKIKVVKSYTKTKKLLYQQQGQQLKYIIEGINKYSNNFMADMLLINLADKNAQNKVTSGAEELTKLATSYAGDKNIKLYNGSGLSPENRISVNAINKLLKNSANDLINAPAFQSSLAVSGKAGSLKRRFIKKEFKNIKNNIRAKTGTLTKPVSVSAIAGYLKHPAYGLLSFAIIQNGMPNRPQPNIVELRHLQEKIIAKAYNMKL